MAQFLNSPKWVWCNNPTIFLFVCIEKTKCHDSRFITVYAILDKIRNARTFLIITTTWNKKKLVLFCCDSMFI